MANLKRHMIELVKEVKEGEVITEKYLTPAFLPLSVVYEALDIAEELEKKGVSEREKFDKMLDFTANQIYGKQFTKEELVNGLHGPNAIETLRNQLFFAAHGAQDEATKKFLAKKR